MHRTLTLALALVGFMTVPSLCRAQATDERAAMEALKTAAQRAMAPMMWLVGDWEGPATITMAPGRTMTLTQRETVRAAAFDQALIIQGRGSMTAGANENVVFEAAGLFAYDAHSKRFLFTSSSGSGAAGTHETTVDGTTLTWAYSVGPMKMRYVISRTADDRWHETGAVSRDGGATWATNFEMTLRRKSRS
ncbi:MAG TPA: DUF1579 family protein [Gemmatimonas sp.]|nr:DUF1579 family protein [Gemmatimonas sp.]